MINFSAKKKGIKFEFGLIFSYVIFWEKGNEAKSQK